MTSGRKIFAKTVLRGKRFDRHAVPVEVLGEFAKYETLVLEVAKALFRKKHFTRKKLPARFEDKFQLYFTEAKHECFKVDLERYSEFDQFFTDLPFPPDEEPDDFELARDTVNQVLDSFARTGEPPEDFPPELVPLFRPLGQSLDDDEVFELGGPEKEAPKATYTRAAREKVIEWSNALTVGPKEWVGAVVSASKKPRSRKFQLKVEGVPLIEGDLPEGRIFEARILKALAKNETHVARVFGTVLFLRRGNRAKFVTVSGVELTLAEETEEQVRWREYLKGLDQRLEYEHAERVRSVWEQVQQAMDEAAPVPSAMRTREGALQLSWNTEQSYLDIEVYPRGLSWYYNNRDEPTSLGTEDDELLQRVPEETIKKLAEFTG